MSAARKPGTKATVNTRPTSTTIMANAKRPAFLCTEAERFACLELLVRKRKRKKENKG